MVAESNRKMDVSGGRWLRGLEEIRTHIRVSLPQMKKWIEYGLPCTNIDGIYYAHRDNIDAWLRHISRSGPREYIETDPIS